MEETIGLYLSQITGMELTITSLETQSGRQGLHDTSQGKSYSTLMLEWFNTSGFDSRLMVRLRKPQRIL